jgi:hypothetical protein
MKPPLLTALAMLFMVYSPALTPKAVAHCDALDGPVVETARLALKKGDVTPVLKWVNKEGEKEVRESFAVALKVRTLGEDAQKLADTHFFETLVRVHRAGEGVPFTGLRPAGTIDPGFAAADKALHEGTLGDVPAQLAKSVQEGLQKRFSEVLERKKHAEENVAAGRAYVAAYVEYAHYVEAIFKLTSQGHGEHHVLHESEKGGN